MLQVKISENKLLEIISKCVISEMETEKKETLSDENASGREKEIISAVKDAIKGLDAYGKDSKEPTLATLSLNGGKEEKPFYKDQHGTMVVDLSGGWNGNGTWDAYFGALKEFIERLTKKEIDAWLIQMENDCPDDMFTASIGLKENNKGKMKIKESELRDIVRTMISEAISNQDARLANKFIKQSKGGGYTARQAGPSNLFQQARQALGARRDENGQMDILRSAEEIYPMIQRYNAEIKKLQRAYNYLNARKDGNYVPKVRKAMDPAQKQRMLATRAANKQARADINARYGDINDPNFSINHYGNVDPTKYNAARERARGRRDDVVRNTDTGQHWLKESVFNFLNREPDEVDQICQNYRKLPVDQMAAAAQKVGARLQEYQNVVQQLQGLLDKWQQQGHLVDRNAEARAKRDAELEALRRRGTYKKAAGLNEAVDNAVREAIKKYLG